MSKPVNACCFGGELSSPSWTNTALALGLRHKLTARIVRRRTAAVTRVAAGRSGGRFSKRLAVSDASKQNGSSSPPPPSGRAASAAPPPWELRFCRAARGLGLGRPGVSREAALLAAVGDTSRGDGPGAAAPACCSAWFRASGAAPASTTAPRSSSWEPSKENGSTAEASTTPAAATAAALPARPGARGRVLMA